MKKVSFFCVLCITFSFLISCVSTNTLDYSEINTPRNSTVYLNTRGDNLDVYNSVAEVFDSVGFKVKFISNVNEIPATKISESSGTGFFFAPNYFLTNAHVLNDDNSITYLKDGKELSAEVVFKSVQNDIAILKTSEPSDHYFELGDSSNYNVSDSIFVLGYPLTDILGTEIRVTNGIINSLTGINGDSNLIQISAQIQPGNSGGPTINDAYKVVGIASSKLADDYIAATKNTIAQNVNFAIKSDIAKLYINEFINEEDINYVSNMTEAMESTVLVLAGGDNLLQEREYIYYLDYGYNANWDVIHYTASNMNMSCIDVSTGNEIAYYSDSYYSASSIYTIAKRQAEEIISQLFEYENKIN